ncbi:MAG: ABC transporter ATP-binding protein [Bacteroidaceae bacterium]|nr:ABC transporter ATP-binding protein [Bacteroidaceae bacterium]
MIEIENLSIGYKKGNRNHSAPLATGLNAALRAGELTCLVGVNGVGKSTLLKTISGFVKPLEGEIRINDIENGKWLSIANLTEVEKSRLLSVVLTERGEVSHLSAYDVVSFGRIPYSGLWGTLSDTDKSIIDNSFTKVGIDHLKSRYFDELSDGERQKVMVAKALAQETPMIILDEPSAFLDYPSKEELMDLLRYLAHSYNKAILLSSHDLDIIRRYADRYWIMEKNMGEARLRTSPTY